MSNVLKANGWLGAFPTNRSASLKAILPLLAVLGIGTLLCRAPPLQAGEPSMVDIAAFWAINPGNVLTYRGKASHHVDWWHEERAEILMPVDFHGTQAKRRAWIETGALTPYSIEYLNVDENHLCYFGERTDEGDTLFNPPICIPRQMEIGQTFSTDTTVISPNGAQAPKTFVLKLVGKEQVTVPAGTFTDSLHSQGGWDDEGPGESYDARGVGWIKGTSNPGVNTGWDSELIAFYSNYGECLLNWAEDNYPNLFSPGGQTTGFSLPYHYRFYSGTNAYLGVSDADNHVYYLSPGGVLHDAGELSQWLATSGCRPAPTRCLFDWAENNYPELFPPTGGTFGTSFSYVYRYYPVTGYFLGIAAADNHVYYQKSGGKMNDAGAFSYLRSQAGCAP